MKRKIRFIFWIKNKAATVRNDNRGVALFMVLSTLAILGVLVTEFTYTSHMNWQIAQNTAESTKAFYLAKAGLSISKLRLKVYRSAKKMIGGSSVAGQIINKTMIEKIWSFPFMFPIPDLPGMTIGQKQALDKFVTTSSFDGSFKTFIESESSKFNINSLLVSAQKTASPAPGSAGTAAGTPQASTSSPAELIEKTRTGLAAMLDNVLNEERNKNEEFAKKYREIRGEEIVTDILAWMDPETQTLSSREDKIQYYGMLDNPMLPKNAPFYILSELHFAKSVDERIYKLILPLLTVSPTSGININYAKPELIKALFPELLDEELKLILDKRDNLMTGALFNSVNDFFDILSQNASRLTNIDDIKKRLQEQNIALITDEDSFKISIEARSGSARSVMTALYSRIGSLVGKKVEDTTKTTTSTSTAGKETSDGEGATTSAKKTKTPAATEQEDDDYRISYIKVN